MNGGAAARSGAGEGLRSFVTLSPRVKFAFKTALAITISYMVPLAMGWNQPYQGAVAIMVIAAAGPLGESLGKGVMRVLGTLAGAAVGLGLIALFPQDPPGYFLSLSLLAAVLVYLYYAYRGDGTFLLVTLMVMVLIFNEGKVDDRFLYALDRSWTTAFGIFVYAVINLYLWPERTREGPLEKVRRLSALWRELLTKDRGAEEAAVLSEAEREWERTLRGAETEYPGGIAMDRRRWERLRPHIRRIDGILGRMGLLGSAARRTELRRFFPDTEPLEEEIGRMLERIEAWWRRPGRLEIPPASSEAAPPRHRERWESLGMLERAELQSLREELRRLYGALRELLIRLDRIAAPGPDIREWIPAGGGGAFLRDDPELWRSALRSMMVFWSGLLLWYFLYPPLGYMVAGLGLVLSLVAFGLYVNPLALIFIYSLSFFFSFVAYVWILPRLYGGWELALYIFGYMFLTYWLIPVPLALFFALGLNFQYILNDRFFSFELFMAMLMLFYLFLGLMLLFYYLPWSNRPESAFLRAWRDWRHRRDRSLCAEGGGTGRASLERMKFQAAKIDRRYFDGADFEALERLLREAEKLAALTELRRELRRRLSPALRRRLESMGACREWSRLDAAALEERLKAAEAALDRGTRELLAQEEGGRSATELAEYLTLSRHAFRSYLQVKRLEERIGVDTLKRSRF